jgi:hypothetical protein
MTPSTDWRTTWTAVHLAALSVDNHGNQQARPAPATVAAVAHYIQQEH